MLFDQQIELFELRFHGVDVAKVEIHHLDQESGFTVCVSAPVSQHEASVRFIPVLVWNLSHHFARSFRRQQYQDIVERSGPLVPSFICRDSLHSWVCCHRSQLGQQRTVHRSHETRQRKFPYAVLLFSSAEGCRLVQPCNFAIVTVLTAPTVD